MADLNDRELVERACDGESGAFDALVQRYRGDMCRLADGYLKGAADAEDVVQESFSEAFRRLSDLREPERFAAWLQSIVRNGSLSHLRNRRVYISYEEIASEGRSQIQVNEDYWGGSPFLAPDEYLARSEERHFVRAAVEKLSEKSRSAMALHYFEDKSYEEMAEELAVPISTIEGRLYRARKQLKEELLKMAKADMDEMALEKVIDEATKDLKDDVAKIKRQLTVISWEDNHWLNHARQAAGQNITKLPTDQENPITWGLAGAYRFGDKQNIGFLF